MAPDAKHLYLQSDVFAERRNPPRRNQRRPWVLNPVAAGKIQMKKTGSRRRGLFESELSFRLLVEGVVDYAIYMLDPNGIITNWNAGARRIKGYEADEVVGRHFQIFYPQEDRAAGLPAYSLETAREKGKFEAEGWRVRKDGTKFLASVVI